ncbi:MAG: lytic transglycosylase domain-containing protein [Azoarcus sp.]|jgi:soluble lytic murein transglycosylase|nr:lytic transglycosylase domain-containing protein [Azoarcus sp.]
MDEKKILRAVVRAASGFFLAWLFATATQAAPKDADAAGESRFLTAREAVRKGDRETLEQLVNEINGHPLDSYVRYWWLFNGLARPLAPSSEELNQFLDDEAGTLLAERLRADWLRRLAKNGDSERFLQIYAGLQNPDNELRCLAWSTRLANGDSKVLNEVAANWDSLTLAHAACTPALRAAAERGKVSSEEVWQLFRRRVDTRSPSRAREVLSWLASNQLKAFDQAVRGPKRYLARLPAKFAASRPGRELALAALARLAREDVDAAHARFLRISKRLTANERAYAWAVLALRAAQKQKPSAAAWYRNAGSTPMSATQRAWRVRVALRAKHWHSVSSAIDGLNAGERALPEWIYWRGRALQTMQRTSEADKEFRRIANTPDFYGILANEELGQAFDPRAAHAAPAVSHLDEPTASNAAIEGEGGAAENAEGGAAEDAEGGETDEGEADSLSLAAPAAVTGPSVDKHPGLQRALALFRLDLRLEAVREWNWALRGRNEAFRLAAAKLALDNHLYDRAITSAELANPAGAWDLRFLTPFREIIAPHALAKNLDISWVYGVMRQESRFIIPSRSASGAQGLMQVMPTTGKWVAKKLGLYYHPGLLRDPEMNVELGTGYMRIILDELEDNAVLAAAGYNAGPSRARRWQDSRPLEGAIYAETIPFDETRDYVKHVMANTAIYAALLEGKPQSLKLRLGTIPPKMD